MTQLSELFEGAAAKILSVVEADITRSNQHEFNGTAALRRALGDERFEERETRFVWLGSEEDVVSSDSFLTWYDARQAHPTRSEWRLYFRDNPVVNLASEGTLLLIGKRSNGSLLCVFTDDDTIQQQLLWLFGLGGALLNSFEGHLIEDRDDRTIGFAESWILEALGIDTVLDEDLPRILERFGNRFPTTAEFSKFARELEGPFVPGIDDPDYKLLQFLQKEERLFKTLERHVISERLNAGFSAQGNVDVDGFMSFSLSVHNRRKSRAGYSLENHIEAIFRSARLEFDRGAKTEGRKTPDFLFPGKDAYHDPAYPSDQLRMLGSKSSCKDRWRQVLTEAARIDQKHLLTLEPSISTTQTLEMQSSNLQLVVPRGIFETYNPEQQGWLMDLSGFMRLVSGHG